MVFSRIGNRIIDFGSGIFLNLLFKVTAFLQFNELIFCHNLQIATLIKEMSELRCGERSFASTLYLTDLCLLPDSKSSLPGCTSWSSWWFVCWFRMPAWMWISSAVHSRIIAEFLFPIHRGTLTMPNLELGNRRQHYSWWCSSKAELHRSMLRLNV